MTAHGVGILITRSALDGAITNGQRGLPAETGGILLGFRTHDLVVATRTLTVPDPGSSRTGYLRHHRRAQARLAAGRGNAPPVVGYVGEWHTHPADVGPSRTDLRALGAVARLSDGPVALVVLADPATSRGRVYGIVMDRRPWPVPAISPVDVVGGDVTVTDDTTESLEAEAAALTGEEGP